MVASDIPNVDETSASNSVTPFSCDMIDSDIPNVDATSASNSATPLSSNDSTLTSLSNEVEGVVNSLVIYLEQRCEKS